MHKSNMQSTSVRPMKRLGRARVFRGLPAALAMSAGLCGGLLAISAASAADWPTHRGSAARTGQVDGLAGPSAGAKIIWVHKSREHYIGSPVADEKRLYVSGLGAFNTAAFHALSLDTAAAKRIEWSKLPPALKLPVVSSPAIVSGRLVFGDGMHQTDGASIHCLAAEGGRTLWRYTIPGQLVHIEGGPTIAEGKVYVGGGHAGVVCLEFGRVKLEGTEQPLDQVQASIDKRWKMMLEQYEKDKLADPDFAIPPNEDALPKAEPILAWQKGQNEWHVDAPVAVADGRVLAASSYLEKEKSGLRALISLKAADGTLNWIAPLKMNPWSGPSIAGDVAVVAGGNIRFDPKEIAAGKGELTAVNLADGSIKWQMDLPGTVLSAVAVRDGLAIFTATDGKVRAVEVATKMVKWTFDASQPFFAGAAVTDKMVYAVDLKGVVHGLNLADGKRVWKLDVGADAAVGMPGMVYGSPIVQGGRIYLATCNLEGAAPGSGTAVICIGEK